MAYYLSPLVDVNEIDLTTTVPAAATSIGVIALRKTWKGPELKKYLVSNLEQLLDAFGEPNDNCYKDMLAAMGYLKYGSNLYCTRAMPATSTFAGAFGEVTTETSSTDMTMSTFTSANSFTMSDLSYEDPDAFYDESSVFGSVAASGSDMVFIANSRGTWGNYVKVAVVDYDTYALVTSAGGGSYTNYINAGGTLGETLWGDVDGLDYPIETHREFVVLVRAAEQEDINKASVPYSLVEVHYVSADENKVDDEGKNIFAPNVINRESKYVRITINSNVTNNDFYNYTSDYTALAGGIDNFTDWDDVDNGTDLENTEVINAYNEYSNEEEVDVNILIDGDKNIAVKRELVTICESRKDCMAILDCPSTYVINRSGSETTLLRDYRLSILNENTSYAAIYGNWLEVFDKWSSKYRWIGAAGHVAGIFANTDDVADPWFAPAGLNRAVLTNVRKLAWNPSQGERDILYKNGINPIVTFSGQGKVLWGQKTLLDKNSAFNRINVRRLFMVIEKAISTSAKYFLFEPNDAFTRLSMVNMVEPYLRDVKGRRGIYDFMIVCDERNNTAERVDRNELWMDIYIKPTRAAEFIVLNFIATKTGASFTELIGSVGEGV